MTSGRLERVLAAVAAENGPIMGRLCKAAVSLLRVDGAGLSVTSNGVAGSLHSQGRGAQAGEDSQLTLGEGPGHDAVAMGVVVENGDLGTGLSTKWPAFSKEMSALGVMSVTSFPLLLGAVRLGALTTYHFQSGTMDGEQRADGYVLAQLATHLVLASHDEAGDDELIEAMRAGFVRLAPMHQATGFVMALLQISASDALARLRARAFASNRSVLEISIDLLAGRLDIDRG